MKYSIIIGGLLFFLSNSVASQFLQENEWATLSDYIKENNQTGFDKFLKTKEFSKSDESNDKYTFYNWKETDGYYYGVRVNKSSGQVTYLTNDQNYVLKLLSRFISEYLLVKSEKKSSNSTTHIFQSQSSTIAVKLDTQAESGTHLLFAVSK